ncbi:hypothetical protein HAP47_0035560 [Bradyrhizobium sp. 41S5]|uniref:Uncharacterized protein n=1 Tax=Bradyrhizobium quebecense TaxID=2748629 RepID=A0A973WTZ1_9BRAD|nr:MULTISPECIES: hypothetical protein [Bradyrhizobium]UFX44318.1 hypothetical protein HAP47_0035560 [Bradyrhizobium sp. 41S5]UGA44286.1 hypothetical protein HU230_0039880 [Bradyrhizobium quebecense]
MPQWEIDHSLAAIQYWAEIIKVIPGQSPAIVNVAGIAIDNAWASIQSSPDGGNKVQAHSRGGSLTYGALGMVAIGQMGFSAEAYIPSQLPMTRKIGLAPVTIHEIAHQMGIASTIDGYEASPHFARSDKWLDGPFAR